MDTNVGIAPALAAARLIPGAGVAERSTGRDVGHGVLLTAGWVLIGVLWVRVLRGTSPQMLVTAVGSVVVCAIVTITLTRLWIAHNVAIFRAKGPRTGTPTVDLDYASDWVGRAVSGDLVAARAAGIVVVCASPSRKVFLSDPSVADLEAAAAPAGLGTDPRPDLAT